MTEREMEDLLWTHSEKLLGEPLRPFRRQPTGEVGRTELVFVDRGESLLIVEARHGKLDRGAIPRMVDSRAMVKKEFRDRAVEMMLVANQIPAERRLACERLDIEAREIPEERFRETAWEAGYRLSSEAESGAPAAMEAEAVEGEIAQSGAPLHAEVVEEAAPEPLHEEPAVTIEGTGRYSALRGRRRHSTAGTLAMALGLLAVGVVAFVFRQELTEGYDRLADLVSEFFSSPTKESGVEPTPVQPKSEPGHKSPAKPKARPTESDNGPDEPVPHFEPVVRPPAPPEEAAPMPPVVKPKEHAPGVAYSILEQHDLSRNGVFEYELKVVVPADYTGEDLARMASDIVGEALKKGLCHAMHFYCFTDKKKTNPEDAFAEVTWAPEGDFTKAAEALRAGPEKNLYNVVFIRDEP